MIFVEAGIAETDRLRDILSRHSLPERWGTLRESFPPAVSTDFQQITTSKDAARRRLRALPWLEKLEMLDRLRASFAPTDTPADF
ncbi:MAG TPA: hypothetical protein VIS71_10570 [Terrimicrobium sp.]